MTLRATDGYPALTEREKQTLRLIVRGHDAKSIARSLDLSVHTVNERLRDARRKLSVSSSREAARMVLQAEGGAPDFVGDKRIGEAATPRAVQDEAAPTVDARPPRRFLWLIGAIVMIFALAFAALLAPPQSAPLSNTVDAVRPANDAVAQAARHWLELGDQARWADAYRGTGDAFRKLNTLERWTTVSEKVRTPLGAVLSRVLIDRQFTPAPPSGFETVKFRARFANKADAVETVTLDREGGSWRVVGILISEG